MQQKIKPDEFERFGERMNFTLMNGKIVSIPTKLAKSIITTELSNEIYWMHNKMLTRDEVLDFLKRRYDSGLFKKVGYYILFYAENLVFTNVLFTVSEGQEKTKEYLEVHIPLLEKLRKLYRSCKVEEMLEKCMEMGIDPL